jgi:pimeloyl-ACP methyl ester carboxylesterase
MPELQLAKTLIHYREAGSGPTVVLLHSSSSHGGQWRRLMETAGGRYRLVAPDLHGYGRSDPLPRDGAPYFRHDTEIVRALVAAAGGRAHLVGHSLGGTVAARFALEEPRAARSLTLIEPVLFNLLEEAGDPRRLEYLELAHAVIVLADLGRNAEAARIFLDYWSGAGAIDRLDAETRAYIIGTMGRVADDWRGVSRHAPGQLGLADFARLAAPTALMCAAETTPAARAIVERLRAAIPAAAYREIADAGHMSPVTHPDMVNPLILSFIDAHAG